MFRVDAPAVRSFRSLGFSPLDTPADAAEARIPGIGITGPESRRSAAEGGPGPP
ncbi:hypothetical protein GCM10010405_49830 [Streptomyces macrosporus]|uniref:Uncharacterized protein n=1 Tax=Streptomyces macrosporus TaxID=44032 RepID=A0ABN3KHA9_9ACTN